MPFCGANRSHTLRYVLKNRKTDKELFVVVFTLLPKDQVGEHGDVAAKKDESKPSVGAPDDELD